MKIVQIKGSNGSGKSTIARDLIKASEHVQLLYSNRNSGYLTILRDLRWIVLGRYPEGSKMGGCDSIHTVNDVKGLLNTASWTYPDYRGILFEGMMISTIKTTFYEYVLQLATRREYIQPIFVILTASLQGCLNRISNRGTMKPNLDTSSVEKKCNSVIKHARTYDQQYVRWLDVENIRRQDMLPWFLELIGEQELVDCLKLGA